MTRPLKRCAAAAILCSGLFACRSQTVAVSVTPSIDHDLASVQRFKPAPAADLLEQNLTRIGLVALEERGYAVESDDADVELRILVESSVGKRHVPARISYLHRSYPFHEDDDHRRRHHRHAYYPVYTGGYDVREFRHTFTITLTDADGAEVWNAKADATGEEPDAIRAGEAVIPDVLLEFPERTERPSVRRVE